MQKKQKSNLRKEARGRNCTIEIPGVCNRNPETVVLCHLNKRSLGAGMGKKTPDIFGAWGCSACHDAVDGRMRTNEDWTMFFYEAVFRTQKILLDEGKI